MSTVDELFRDKNEVTFYVPVGVAEDKANRLIVELLDSISAYVSPLVYGLGKGDVYDYITSPLYEKVDLLTFLKHKRYVTDDTEFVEIFKKYSELTTGDPYVKCYEVNVKLASASADTINEVELSGIINALLNDKVPAKSASNITIKRTNYMQASGKFSYIVSV